MTEVGLAKIDQTVLDEEPQAPAPKPAKTELVVPPFVEDALKATPAAWTHFEKLAPSCRREYIRWIMDAKKEETRLRRLREAVSLLEQNKKLGMK